MFTYYNQIVKDSTPGAFDYGSPMTAYLNERTMLGDTGDDFILNGDGNGCAYRFGRRILQITDRGFILSFKFDTVAEAERWMQQAREDEAEGWVRVHGNWVD